MADLHTTSFKEGWNSAPFQSLRAAHLRKDVTGTACEKCAAYEHASDPRKLEGKRELRVIA